jgi:hypothetical protein
MISFEWVVNIFLFLASKTRRPQWLPVRIKLNGHHVSMRRFNVEPKRLSFQQMPVRHPVRSKSPNWLLLRLWSGGRDFLRARTLNTTLQGLVS